MSSRRGSLWKDVRPISNAFVLDRKSSSPKLPSIDELSLPLRRPAFVAPPPPVLFSHPSIDSMRIRPHSLQADHDVGMHSEPRSRSRSSSPVMLPLTPGVSETTQSSAQRIQPPQPNPRERAKELKRSERLFRMVMEETDLLKPKAEPCCSVSEAKAEIKVLMEKFKSGYERTLTRVFGEDWEKSSPKDEDAPLPRLPSPPTHPPVLPDLDHQPARAARPSVYRPPLPPPPPFPIFPTRSMLSVPPPPPLPRMIPPPPSLMVAPPPPTCIIPPPPPPPFICGTSVFDRQPGPQEGRQARSPSSCASTPPLPPPPPSWIPAVAFNPVQTADSCKNTATEAERQDREQTVHKDVTCDFCGKQDIKGTRFKCLQCPGVYRCRSSLVTIAD